MPEQLPHPERLAAAWADARDAGVSEEQLREAVQDAIRSAKTDRLDWRIRQMIQAGGAEHGRLGFVAFGYGNDLYAAVVVGSTGDDDIRYSYRVVRLGDQAYDDIVVATITVDGLPDQQTVARAAREKLDSVHGDRAIVRFARANQNRDRLLSETTANMPVRGGYACFRHDDGHVYEIFQVGVEGDAIQCTVVRLCRQPVEDSQVAAFEAQPPLHGRDAVIRRAYDEVTHANLEAALPATAKVSFTIPPTTTEKETSTDA